MRLGQSGRMRKITIVEDSPLRILDPRTKLILCLFISLAVMTPLDRLVAFLCGYLVFITWSKLLSIMGQQIWKMKWILIILFFMDWLLVGLGLATLITLRLILMAGVFTLLFSTTTSSELGLALEELGLPYRWAFSINLAFQSVGLLNDEWQTILEAQKVRGFSIRFKKLKDFNQISELIALTVPAIVLSTRRAWSLTEAAYARGFDSPKRLSYRTLKLTHLDWLYMAAPVSIFFLIFWR
ncbi:MAG: energy-coupling factor transporter transmembrane protein EcfT [Anaerolineaceae bacterium]|nr:energy-coupling factor transporter transmembrane protein EcfT [Anaerolineaceae bacterium]